jgi:outer membrane protein OmpA-like peptidoglycan-associated protein
MNTNIRNRIAMISLLAAATAMACAHDPTKELVAARAAYEDASKGAANELAPADVYEAGKALAAAERAHDDKPGSDKERDLAYVAHRKAELAAAKAEQTIAQEDRQNAKQTYVAKLEEGREAADARARAAQGSLDATQQALGAERDRRKDMENQLGAAVASFDELAKMQQANARTVITLDGSVLFTSDSANLLAPAMSKLQKVAEVITEYDDDYQITIEGHTDSRGSSKHNHDLSEKRAEAVKQFLVGKGVKPEVVKAVGMGEDVPVAPNTTPEGRADNRRVEVVIEPVKKSGEKSKKKK